MHFQSACRCLAADIVCCLDKARKPGESRSDAIAGIVAVSNITVRCDVKEFAANIVKCFDAPNNGKSREDRLYDLLCNSQDDGFQLADYKLSPKLKQASTEDQAFRQLQEGIVLTPLHDYGARRRHAT